MSGNIKVFNFENRDLHFRRTAGSHIPLLRRVAKFFDIKSVIEFGTGIYSLRTFLDKKYYPNLEKINSYETEEVWGHYVKKNVKDARWEMTFMGKTIDGPDKVKFDYPVDLVFVDGTDDHRSLILKKYKFLSNLFILHDCDASFHKCLIKEFKYSFVYVPPKYRHTAILSDIIDVSKISWDIKWEEDFLKWI